MTTAVTVNRSITLQQLYLDPYSIYKKLRAEAPVTRVEATGRTLLTKAADTKAVKLNPAVFSSNDPNTPMQRAFQAQTLMRKDFDDHARERNAMLDAFNPRIIKEQWMPHYRDAAVAYVDQLPVGETVDLFPTLSGPWAARGLGWILGLQSASDNDLQRWSQTLIDGAGNFGWLPAPFEASDQSNTELDELMQRLASDLRVNPNNSALSVMVNADEPIEWTQIRSNIKIAIGGGINEPRDALNTALVGLLSNPEQLEEVKRQQDWEKAFEEAIRWVAPIQVSSRLVLEDTEIRNCYIPKGDTIMTIQASACHDEELYLEPDKFDVYRKKAPHQAFGNGPHFCMGTHVARWVISQIMLPLLFERFPNMQLSNTEDVKWRGFGFRGPVNLPVKLIR